MPFLPQSFFDAIKGPLFGGAFTQEQVNGLQTLWNAWLTYGDQNRQRCAYGAFATPYHETGRKMLPVYEVGSHDYFNKYDAGTPIGIRLGNTKPGDGFLFRGRGDVQLTGRRNYTFVGEQLGLPLAASPDLAMDSAIAARILVVGEMKGWFTGKSLGAFIDDIDEADDDEVKEYLQGRRVINGQDRAALIADYALKFEHALAAADLLAG